MVSRLIHHTNSQSCYRRRRREARTLWVSSHTPWYTLLVNIGFQRGHHTCHRPIPTGRLSCTDLRHPCRRRRLRLPVHPAVCQRQRPTACRRWALMPICIHLVPGNGVDRLRIVEALMGALVATTLAMAAAAKMPLANREVMTQVEKLRLTHRNTKRVHSCAFSLTRRRYV